MVVGKKVNKRIYFLLIGLILLVSIFCINKSSSIISFFSYKSENRNVATEELTNVVNKMYITILDDKANVVASTNPKAVIHDDYYFGNGGQPRVKLDYDKSYVLLLEMEDTGYADGKTKLKEDVIYGMDLPDSIVATSPYDTDITDSCYDFFSENEISACGGVYTDNDLKMMFSNIEGKYDIRFNYQFSIKFNESLKDDGFDIETIDFGKYGSVQLYFKANTPVEPGDVPGTKYDVDVTYNGYTSSTENYLKWSVVLEGLNGNNDFDGTLTVTPGSGMGINGDVNIPFEYIDVYVDGEKLAKEYFGGKFSGCFYRETEEDCLIRINTEYSSYVTFQNQANNAELIQKMFFVFDEIEDINKVKIDFVFKDYNYTFRDRDYFTFALTAKYVDDANVHDIYSDSVAYTKQYDPDTFSFDCESIESTVVEYPEGFSCSATVYNDNKNYVYLLYEPEFENNTGAFYYMSEEGFLSETDELTNSIRIKINDEEVTFHKSDIGYDSLVNSQFEKNDPALLYQIGKSSNFFGASKNTYVYRGDKVNADGDSYWLVVSENTISAIENIDNNNVFDDKFTVMGDSLGYPAAWEITLYNVPYDKIEISWDELLERVNYIDEFNTYHELNKRFSVNNGAITDDLEFYVPEPMHISPEILNNNYVKWDVLLNVNTIQETNSKFDSFPIQIYVPESMSIGNSGYYYDVTKKKMVNGIPSNDFNMLATNKVYACDTVDDNGICTSFKALGDDLDSTFSYRYDYNPAYFQPNDYRYYYNNTNVEISDEGYVHFVFFTRVDSYRKFDNYSQNEIYVQLLLDSNLRTENGINIGEGLSMPRYDLVGESAIQFPKTSISLEGESSDGSTIVKEWQNEVWYNKSYNYSTYCYGGLYYQYPCREPITLNGTYQFTSIYEPNSNNNFEIAISNNSILSGVEATYYASEDDYTIESIDLSIHDFTEEYTKCDNNGVCLIVESKNKTSPNLKEGFSVSISGLRDVDHLKIKYYTSTDIRAAKEAANLNYFGETSVGVDHDMDSYNWNYVIWDGTGVWRDSYYSVIADLNVSHTSTRGDTMDRTDSRQEAEVKIGYSTSEYVDIVEFIDGATNIIIDTDDNVSIDDLAEVANHIRIDDLRISVAENDGSRTLVYDGTSFLAGFTSSTLEFGGDDGELIKLHLVKNGSVLDKVTVFMNYKIKLLDSIKTSDVYNGGLIDISVNTKGVRSFECDSCTSASYYDNYAYPNEVDAENMRLIAYASGQANKFAYTYLVKPKIDKEAYYENDELCWEIIYEANNAGKNGPISIDIDDELSVEGNYGNNSAFATFKELVLNMVQYTDIRLYYNGEEYSVPSTNSTVTVNGVEAVFTPIEHGFNVSMPIVNYNDVVVITYKLAYNEFELYNQAVAAGIINSSGYMSGYSTPLSYWISNGADDNQNNQHSSSYRSLSRCRSGRYSMPPM